LCCYAAARNVALVDGRVLDVDHVVRAACIAHDLRSPLSTIQICLGVLRARLPEQPTAVEALTLIERNISYMERLLSNLVDLSAVEHGEVELRREDADVVAVLLRVRERMMQDATRLCFEVPSGAVIASIDAGRIERVLANLIENALKYGPRDAPVIVRLTRHGSSVRITVADGGPALAREHANEIFERHRRLGTQGGHDGAGLGLYLSRRIVEAHGGTMGVVAGPTSCFFVELPA